MKTLTWVISILLLCLNIFKLCKIRYSTFSICTCIFYYIAVSPNCSIVPRIPRVKDIDLERTYEEPRPTGMCGDGQGRDGCRTTSCLSYSKHNEKYLFRESRLYRSLSECMCAPYLILLRIHFPTLMKEITGGKNLMRRVETFSSLSFATNFALFLNFSNLFLLTYTHRCKVHMYMHWFLREIIRAQSQLSDVARQGKTQRLHIVFFFSTSQEELN